MPLPGRDGGDLDGEPACGHPFAGGHLVGVPVDSGGRPHRQLLGVVVQLVEGEVDGRGDAVSGEGSGHHPFPVPLANGLAVEGDVGVGARVQEFRGPNVVVALGVAGVEAGRVHDGVQCCSDQGFGDGQVGFAQVDRAGDAGEAEEVPGVNRTVVRVGSMR